MRIGIMTTTFNREILLTRLYESLAQQSDKDFIWCIIDDGSTDNTYNLIKEWINSNPKFEIRYYYVQNGGKSRALNYGFRENDDIDFFAIIDSDDYTIPNAIEIIKGKVEYYSNNSEIGAIFFRYMDTKKKLLTNNRGRIQSDDVEMTRYEYDSIYSKDDGCIGYYNRVTRKYSFPEYPGEKYVGPIVLQMLMSEQYKIAFCMEVIGVAEYQNEGLTRTGRVLRINNPLGMIHYCGLLQSKCNRSTLQRIKYAIEAQAYAILSPYSVKELQEKGISKKWIKVWAWPFGLFLSQIWRRKMEC